MEPIDPRYLPDGWIAQVIAKDQPEYVPLPCIRNPKDEHGTVVTRWVLDDQERDAIAKGGDLYLELWTFNRPLQPVKLAAFLPDVETPMTRSWRGRFRAWWARRPRLKPYQGVYGGPEVNETT